MKRLAWCVFVILPSGVFAADVYRSVDENGQVVYSDRPSDVAERVNVQFAAAPRAAAGQEQDEAEDEAAADDSPLGAQIPREATPEEIAEDRARNCSYARQMAETYSVSHRLFRTTSSGEREYLTDAEITAARQKAESDVATWCD